MDALDSILYEDKFNAKLKANLEMDKDKRKRRLAAIDAREKSVNVRPCYRNFIDKLEIPTDVPVSPMCGNTLPSVRLFGSKF